MRRFSSWRTRPGRVAIAGRIADYVKLATAYHPARGRLSSALRAYIQQNALQPYMDTSFPDPRRWAMLALAAAHQDFLEFVLLASDDDRGG